MTPLLVALGAAVGAPLRYLAGSRLDGRWNAGTLTVNLLGSLLLGWLSALALGGHATALLGTGFCGGFTTYSSFAVKTTEMGRTGGLLYAAATVAGALLLATAGFALGQR